MYKVIILPLAKQDIKESAYWYNSRQQGLGKRFALQVRHTITTLKETPFAFQVRYDDVRTVLLDVFPFMIHYNADGQHHLIIISAVLHTSRNPDLWNGERGSPNI
ncbi:hypothetical protein BH09BAC6_BH09BAC6_09010 [soil metagenome]|jgi:plasmid stabilization system protein ParE